MARPRISDDERRSEFLAVRLTPAERLSLVAEAERLSLSLADLARQRLTNGRVVVHEHRKLDPRQVLELGRIGVNLNQIARALNSGQHLNPVSIDGAIAELKELIASLLLVRPAEAEPTPARPRPGPVVRPPTGAPRGS